MLIIYVLEKNTIREQYENCNETIYPGHSHCFKSTFTMVIFYNILYLQHSYNKNNFAADEYLSFKNWRLNPGWNPLNSMACKSSRINI